MAHLQPEGCVSDIHPGSMECYPYLLSRRSKISANCNDDNQFDENRRKPGLKNDHPERIVYVGTTCLHLNDVEEHYED